MATMLRFASDDDDDDTVMDSSFQDPGLRALTSAAVLAPAFVFHGPIAYPSESPKIKLPAFLFSIFGERERQREHSILV